jgi:hypothetical protein
VLQRRVMPRANELRTGVGPADISNKAGLRQGSAPNLGDVPD